VCAVLGALALPGVVACNAIIGLSDFKEGECPGARCGDGGLPDQLAESSVDAPVDVAVDVKGADPVSWAKWKMPNYDGGAVFLPNPPSYTAAGADIAADNVTGLVWRTSVLPSDVTVEAAKSACAALDPASGPWRLPKRIELVTLLDYSRTPIRIDTATFKGVKNVRAWTSSEVRPLKNANDAEYWAVNFETGAVEPVRADFELKALCVRAK